MNMKTGKGWVEVGNAVIADEFFQAAMAVSYHWFLAVVIISNNCGYLHHYIVLWFYFPGSGAIIHQINAELLHWSLCDYAEDSCGEGPSQSAFLPSRVGRYWPFIGYYIWSFKKTVLYLKVILLMVIGICVGDGWGWKD